MAYKALYRTYRPTTFEEVVGQKHIVLTLQNAITQNKIAHAYLFSGPRGTGKTTVAKLVAKAVNCLNPTDKPCNQCHHCVSINKGIHPDIVEIDAASNNGVDEIRDLIERVKYAPIEARFKVYIIDEVHMLSAGAFNALLKTLEEPPAHVIFILATTEAHKVLPTIISRCQRFDFSKVPHKEIAERVEEVLHQENIKYEKEVVRLISLLAEGGLRDALSILEQVIAYGQNELTAKHVHDIYGITTVAEKLDLLESVIAQDAMLVLEKVRKINEKSYDIKRLTSDLIDILKEAVIYSFTKDVNLLQILTIEEIQTITSKINQQDSLQLIDVLIDTMEKYRNATNINSYFEVCLLKMMGIIKLDTAKLSVDVDALVEIPKQQKKVAKHQETSNQKAETNIEKTVESNSSIESKQSEPTIETVLFDSLEPETIQTSKTDMENTVKEIETEEILSYMAAAIKEYRQQDSSNWNKLEELSLQLNWAKTARLLMPSEIVASGEDFILLAISYLEKVKAVNDSKNQKELSDLMIEVLGKEKVVVAITKKAADEAIEEFKQRHTKGTLPKPIKIIKKEHIEDNSSKQPSIRDQVINLFGEDVPFIVEE